MGAGHISTDVIEKLNLGLTGSQFKLIFDGNICTLKISATDSKDLMHQIEGGIYSILYYVSLYLNEAINITKILGSNGKCKFNLMVYNPVGQFQTSDRESQQKRIIDAYNHTNLKNKRLFTAVSYYYKVLRIYQLVLHNYELNSEIFLNLYKILEMLFTSKRDKWREELKKLDYNDNEIEKWFIPIYLIRNEFDIGHSTFYIPTDDERSAVEDFLRIVNVKIQKLLIKLLDYVIKEKYTLIEVHDNHNKKIELLNSIKNYVQENKDEITNSNK